MAATKTSQVYKRSPWSGKVYSSPPSVEELTRESKNVLSRHPTIAKTMRLESMDEFINKFKLAHKL